MDTELQFVIMKWRYEGICYYDTVKESKVQLLIEQDDFRTLFILFVDWFDETKNDYRNQW